MGANFHDSFPERVYKAPIFPALNDAKRLGEKTGSGFYTFDSKRKTLPDAKGLAPFLEASRKVNNLATRHLYWWCDWPDADNRCSLYEKLEPLCRPMCSAVVCISRGVEPSASISGR